MPITKATVLLQTDLWERTTIKKNCIQIYFEEEIKSFKKTFNCETKSHLQSKACLLFASDSSGHLLTGRPGRFFAICLREGTYTLCARRALGLRCGEKQLLG